MTLLRFLSFVALAVWVGGLGVLGGVAAPTLFTVLQAPDPAAGRDLAGAAFGAIFERFQIVAWVCGGLLLALFGTRAALGPRPFRLRYRVWTVVAMLSLSIATAIFVVPRMNRIRDDASGAVASLPAEDARRVEFGRLHGLANGLMLLTLAAGLVVFWFEAKDTA